MSENCGNCRFFTDLKISDGTITNHGHCRRYPPQMSGGARFPMVEKKEYCGEWRGKEESPGGSSTCNRCGDTLPPTHPDWLCPPCREMWTRTGGQPERIPVNRCKCGSGKLTITACMDGEDFEIECIVCHRFVKSNGGDGREGKYINARFRWNEQNRQQS